ncbi:ECF family RNA polymerase sigma factor W [metagenome]|uniref:ECF family RNA polymerase sigma factor W n=1 Tax=metagenome TaxID=256318 RepID=A0A2P2BXD2_9ZZZZ
MSVPIEEAELVARAKAGDQLAFGELASEHRTRLWSICLRITGNQFDAEDALQDALTAAWLHLGKFRGDSRFGTWIYRIAANAAIALIKRNKEVPTDQFGILDREIRSDFTERFADHDRITAALAELPEQFREALVLREYGDFSYDEIAMHQGVPVQTVKSRLNRARASLAANLGGS